MAQYQALKQRQELKRLPFFMLSDAPPAMPHSYVTISKWPRLTSKGQEVLPMGSFGKPSGKPNSKDCKRGMALFV